MTDLVLPRSRAQRIRRSQRLFLTVPIIVAGTSQRGAVFQEETTTMLVNAHGGLLLLAERVHDGQTLMILNTLTKEQCQCTVIETAGKVDGKFEIGVEFDKPFPHFWRVIFPPDDWSIHSPEAKRFKDEEEATKNPGPSK